MLPAPGAPPGIPPPKPSGGVPPGPPFPSGGPPAGAPEGGLPAGSWAAEAGAVPQAVMVISKSAVQSKIASGFFMVQVLLVFCSGENLTHEPYNKLRTRKKFRVLND